MSEQPQQIDSEAAADVAKREALKALQREASEVSDFQMDTALRRNGKEGRPIGGSGTAETYTPLEPRPEPEAIPFQGGVSELQESIQNGDEIVDNPESEVLRVFNSEKEFKPGSTVKNIGLVLEKAEKELE
jgi:hypothetical protein